MMQRARPLLGTIVTIAADVGQSAVQEAFAAVERVQALMNFHSSEGDIARINREAHRRSVMVDSWTHRVLSTAQELSARSEGAFDVTVPGSGATYADLMIEPDRRVRLRRRARIDLGGIAKGFAVDKAFEALQRNGARLASVNAGGDLRLLGGHTMPVRVRLPADPTRAIVLPPVTQRAFATSGSYFGTRPYDPRTRRRRALHASITVAAPTCMVADALTKAIALLGPLPFLMRSYNAAAFAVDDDGQLHAAAG